MWQTSVPVNDSVLHYDGSRLFWGGDGGGTGEQGPPGASGSSSLAITTGSAQSTGNNISSPTAIVNLSSGVFKVRLTGTATAYIDVDYSSITAQGDLRILIQSTGVSLSNLDSVFRTFTSTSDAQQTKFVNFRSTSDSVDVNFYTFESTSDAQQTKFVNFRATSDVKDVGFHTYQSTADAEIATMLKNSVGVVFATNTMRALAGGVVQNNEGVITSTMVKRIGINSVIVSTDSLQGGTSFYVKVGSATELTVNSTFTIIGATWCVSPNVCLVFPSSIPATDNNHWAFTRNVGKFYYLAWVADNAGAAGGGGGGGGSVSLSTGAEKFSQTFTTLSIVTNIPSSMSTYGQGGASLTLNVPIEINFNLISVKLSTALGASGPTIDGSTYTWRLSYSSQTHQSGQWEGIMSDLYRSEELYLDFVWYTTTTVGTVVFQNELWRKSFGTNARVISFDVGTSSEVTVQGTEGALMRTVIPIANDGLLRNEKFAVKLDRLPDDAGDTARAPIHVENVRVTNFRP